MNKKTTAMMALLQYIDVLDQKNLPEYTMAIAIKIKAIELLEVEKNQLHEALILSAETMHDILSGESTKSYNQVVQEFLTQYYQK